MSYIINIQIEVQADSSKQAREEAQRIVRGLKEMRDIEIPDYLEVTEDDLDEIL